jgi:hypothetical protein
LAEEGWEQYIYSYETETHSWPVGR